MVQDIFTASSSTGAWIGAVELRYVTRQVGEAASIDIEIVSTQLSLMGSMLKEPHM